MGDRAVNGAMMYDVDGVGGPRCIAASCGMAMYGICHKGCATGWDVII